MGWSEAPHLDEKTKQEMLASTPPYLRDARSKGEPTLGAGNIYPIPIRDIEVTPFEIPSNWKRAYGLDVGWNRTAAIWGAQSATEGIIYLYTEHYLGREQPVVHATAIRERGDWMKGACDPAARASSQKDGEALMAMYTNEQNRLHLVPANNEITAGLEAIWQGLSIGRIKIFSTMQNFKKEYRGYRRDINGKLIKEHDHLMDAMRYLIRTWDKVAGLPPAGPQLGGWNTAVLDSIAGV